VFVHRNCVLRCRFDELVVAIGGNRDRAVHLAGILATVDESASHGILLTTGTHRLDGLQSRSRSLPPQCFHVQHLTRAEFERVVSEALESLPVRFSRLVKNIAIAVEEEPTDEDLETLDRDDLDDGDSELLGIYRGVALTERTHDMPLLPDEIAVFRGPINRVTRSRKEAVDEIRETVMHELGHYFGLDDDDMDHPE
jgi:predicted Zn-dependent protease with MMP-like domain